MTIFLRVVGVPRELKGLRLRDAIHAWRNVETHDRAPYAGVLYDRDPGALSDVPGSPFAYWVSRKASESFRGHPALERGDRTVKQGLVTTDDFRFLRTWWELAVTGSSGRWRPFAKGGTYSRFFADVYLCVDWLGDGAQSRAIYLARRDVVGGIIKNPDYYGRPGLTWPRRTNDLSVRALPRGAIFADKGPSAFVEDDDSSALLSLMAIMNSSTFEYLLVAQLARAELARSYEVGLIQQTPVPEVSREDRERLAELAGRAWALKRRLDSVNETSHAFVLPLGLAERVLGLDPPAVEAELRKIQWEIDQEAFRLYGFGADDQAEINAFLDRSKPSMGEIAGEESVDDENADDENESEGESSDDAGRDSAVEIRSWLVGVAFGRFDLRLATAERPVPPDPEPFDPLPAVSPGMWPVDEPRPTAPPDILVDDAGHPRDLTALIRSIADSVDVPLPEPDELRAWLAKEFFPLHLKMYSKSRRKAPIYWQLATRSGRYSVWLYIHAFSPDTMFRVQAEYVVPKLRLEEQRLSQLRAEAGERATAAQRKAIAEKESLVDELRDLLDEVQRVTALWNPDLDDGVIINFAPFWRLVPQHRQWQRELKSTWDALREGRYDWSHLAMRLWPERVVPKCATDRSLAIAHGLEDALWEQVDGRWRPRRKPVRSVSELVAERAPSDAVRAALRDLEQAPTAATRRRGRPARGTGGQ